MINSRFIPVHRLTPTFHNSVLWLRIYWNFSSIIMLTQAKVVKDQSVGLGKLGPLKWLSIWFQFRPKNRADHLLSIFDLVCIVCGRTIIGKHAHKTSDWCAPFLWRRRHNLSITQPIHRSARKHTQISNNTNFTKMVLKFGIPNPSTLMNHIHTPKTSKLWAVIPIHLIHKEKVRLHLFSDL